MRYRVPAPAPESTFDALRGAGDGGIMISRLAPDRISETRRKHWCMGLFHAAGVQGPVIRWPAGRGSSHFL